MKFKTTSNKKVTPVSNSRAKHGVRLHRCQWVRGFSNKITSAWDHCQERHPATEMFKVMAFGETRDIQIGLVCAKHSTDVVRMGFKIR